MRAGDGVERVDGGRREAVGDQLLAHRLRREQRRVGDGVPRARGARLVARGLGIEIGAGHHRHGGGDGAGHAGDQHDAAVGRARRDAEHEAEDRDGAVLHAEDDVAERRPERRLDAGPMASSCANGATNAHANLVRRRIVVAPTWIDRRCTCDGAAAWRRVASGCTIHARNHGFAQSLPRLACVVQCNTAKTGRARIANRARTAFDFRQRIVQYLPAGTTHATQNIHPAARSRPRSPPAGITMGMAGAGGGHDQGRRPAFAVRHDGDQRDVAEGRRVDDDRRDQRQGRRDGQEARGGGRRSRRRTGRCSPRRRAS